VIVVLQPGSTDSQVRAVVAAVEGAGGRARPMRASGKPVVHVLAPGRLRPRRLRRLPGVQEVVPISPPSALAAPRAWFPYHFLGHLALGLLILGGLVFLAGFWPPGLGRAPGETLVWVPPWYLRALENGRTLLGGGGLGTTALVVMAVAIICLPELDRTRSASWRHRWPVLLLGFLFFLGFLWLTFAGPR